MPKLFVPFLVSSFALGAMGLGFMHLAWLVLDFGIAAAWSGLFIFAALIFRWRSLWLLLSAPLALFPAFTILMVICCCTGPTRDF